MAVRQTLRELVDDVRAGALKLGEAKVLIDNDQVFLYVGEEKVFDMHPAEVLPQALDLLGLPNEAV